MPKRIEKFRELRGRIKAKGYTGQELAAEIGMSNAAISTKMIGLKPFTLPEVYKIMKVLEIPSNQMHVYFPNDWTGSRAG